MAVRKITMIGHKALHQPTKKVKVVTEDIRTLVADMFDTMEAAKGAGLAANQVAARWRIFTYDCPDENHERHRGYVVNPVLERAPGPYGPADPEEDLEGCLSVPGESFPLARAPWARVTGTDLDGNPVTVAGGGTLGRCLQHEVDHLDGHLYVERLAAAEKFLSREAIKDRGWSRDGIFKWDPATQEAEDI